jgi:MoCo/4Fe-4S cofactor protein with predicted Tat translocation signal
MAEPAPHLDLDQARRRLEGARGPDYWRSLEELAGAEGFEEMLHKEFPSPPTPPPPVGGGAGEGGDGFDRRKFLKLMGASLALAGLTGCGSSPREPIIPYTSAPEELIPGRALYFATAMPLAGYGSGLLVESHEGRPTKVEGNPDHPTGRLPEDSPGSDLRADNPQRPRFGPSDLFAQASILTLYDPDRAQSVNRVGQPASWEAFVEEISRRTRGREPDAVNPNVRIRLLTGTVTSPALAQQIRDVLARFGANAKWHVYEPAGRDNARLGARFAFDEEVEAVYDFTNADVILSLDADFLSCGPGHLRYVRDFSSRRRVRGRQPAMNRLYAVESTPTNTGAMADHRWPLRAAQVESFARAVATALGLEGVGSGSGPAHGLSADVVRAVADDLRRAGERSLVLAGDGQPPLVHALAHALNARLGNVGPGKTVDYLTAVEVRPDEPEDAALRNDPAGSLRQLVRDMENRQVDLLFVLGSNPVYSAPADVPFARALDRVPLRVHLNLYEDETSALCHWHVPEAHHLESWGDVRAYDGTVSILQPLIAPLYGGRSAHEILALLTGHPERSAYEVVRAYWRQSGGRVVELPTGREQRQRLRESPPAVRGGFEAWWRKAVHDGLVARTRATQSRPDLQPSSAWSQAPGVPQGAGQGLEVVFRPDPALFDGHFANNGWLQELPRPLSKITWDNAAYMSPATAVSQNLAPQGNPEQATGKVVSLAYRTRDGELTVEAPVFVIPGHADNSVTLHLGGGRSRSGRVGTGVGFNANRLRTAGAFWFAHGVALTDLNRRHPLARTQHHHTMHGRDIVRDGELRGGRVEIEPIPPAAHEPRRTRHELPTLYPEVRYDGNKWGMAIDQTLCTGCSACIVACQAENNIPVVGKDQVIAGREMHWLRVDNYYKGRPEHPESLKTFFQPVPCMQCENAPCEVVCPVAATAHSHDGLNDMVYNRCVGTRYCSNNCPYKVRRFNFLQFQDWDTESLRAMRNPDVTVRSRGVMEKCTYCVQRIRHGQIQAQLRVRGGAGPNGQDERWEVRDGEVQTACQAACPAGAIIFGDLNGRGVGPEEEHSRVAQLQAEPLNYGLLWELNTRPRTTYLAAVKNPNPRLRPEGGPR